MNISYNAWRTYKECPKKFHLEYMKKAPPTVLVNDYFKLYGLLVEKFFEMFCNIWRFNTAFMPSDMIRDKMSILYEGILNTTTVMWSEPYCRLSSEEIFEKAVGDVCAIMDSQNQNYFLNSKSEVTIELRLKDSNVITGRLDFIHNDPIFRDNDTIIDGKGSGKIGKNVSDDQIFFYSLLYLFKYGKLPIEAGFFYYQYNTFIPVPVDEKKINEFRARLSLDVKNIMTSDYLPTPCAKSCKYCNYIEGCTAGTEAKIKRMKGSRIKNIKGDGLVEFSF